MHSELSFLRLIIARVMAIVFISLLLMNGFVMLVSPVRWFSMKWWLKLQGTLTAERYSRGFGALQVRILGGIVIVSILWMAYELFLAQARLT